MPEPTLQVELTSGTQVNPVTGAKRQATLLEGARGPLRFHRVFVDDEPIDIETVAGELRAAAEEVNAAAEGLTVSAQLAADPQAQPADRQ